MGANLFGGRFLAFKEPAWHKLGIVFTEPITAEQAIITGRMDYKVEKMPLSGTVNTPFGTQLVPLAGKYALVREPVSGDDAYRPFGIVGEDYTYLQNIEMGQLLDQLTSDWHVETAGALGQGETIFLTLDAGGAIEIPGDTSPLKNYFLVTDKRDGGSAMQLAFTPVRVVCQNTLTAGLRDAVATVKLPHNPGLYADLDFRMKLLQKVQQMQGQKVEAFNFLAKLILTADEIETVLAKTYPLPNQPAKVKLFSDVDPSWATVFGEMKEKVDGLQAQWQYYCRTAVVRRDEVKVKLQKFNDEFPGVAGTGWALYNAVVENEDYRTGPESMFESAVFGERANTKQRAFDAVVVR